MMGRYVLSLTAALFLCFTMMPVHAESLSAPTRLAKLSTSKSDVYLLRGFGGVFSRGLDQMANMLTRKRVKANVLPHVQWQQAASNIVANRKKYGRRPVVLIGHSLGANAVLKIARVLKRKRIPVSYMVTFAATAPEPASSNIRRLTNYYFKTDGWGLPIKKGPGFRGVLKNIDYSNSETVGHFNIDKQPNIQRQVVRNILRHVRPSKTAEIESRDTAAPLG